MKKKTSGLQSLCCNFCCCSVKRSTQDWKKTLIKEHIESIRSSRPRSISEGKEKKTHILNFMYLLLCLARVDSSWHNYKIIESFAVCFVDGNAKSSFWTRENFNFPILYRAKRARMNSSYGRWIFWRSAVIGQSHKIYSCLRVNEQRNKPGARKYAKQEVFHRYAWWSEMNVCMFV